MSDRALILAGGKGTRLAPLTTIIPKPLVPVGDVSILEILIRQFVREDITDVTISLGHLGHLIEAVVGDGSQWGARVRYTRETKPLGTAGALALLENIDSDDDIVVVNGDTFTDLSFAKLLVHHRSVEADATIAVHRRAVDVDFGVIEMNETGELARYTEKPTFDFSVSMGVNVISAPMLDILEPERHIDMPLFLQNIQKSGGSVHCFAHQGHWMDLGRIDDVRSATEYFENSREHFLDAE